MNERTHTRMHARAREVSFYFDFFDPLDKTRCEHAGCILCSECLTHLHDLSPPLFSAQVSLTKDKHTDRQTDRQTGVTLDERQTDRQLFEVKKM